MEVFLTGRREKDRKPFFVLNAIMCYGILRGGKSRDGSVKITNCQEISTCYRHKNIEKSHLYP